ncbi:hypothetical protein [Paenibacillus sp. HJGM_3]|uniref:hypothetical protein n=1 Tax=Paenibacillus sp. HJGM_3 TaxID=3379816 RepID=UPI00386E6938
MIEGYKLKTEWEMERLAWHAANVMNVHLKKPVTVKRLLGKERRQTLESKAEEFEKLAKLMPQIKGVQ